MTFVIPDYVDGRRLAAARTRLAGQIDAARFIRGNGLYTLVQPVEVDLTFRLDEHQRVRVSGYLRGVVEMQCQRCLDLVRVAVDCGLDDEALDDSPVQVAPPNTDSNEPFGLLEFVEDEFMLACPMIALHPAGTCQPPGGSAHLTGGGANPFDVLTALRQNKR
jgi:uncharacterized protein